VSYFFQQLVNGVSLGSVYALLALGVTLVWGVLNVLNFAHAQFITWGAFGTYLALEHHISVALAILIGMATGAALAVVLERVIISVLVRRPQTNDFTFVVATIGAGLMLETLVQQLSGSAIDQFPAQGFPSGSWTVWSVSISQLEVTVLAATVLITVALGFWLRYTSLGRELRAVAYSREIAQLLGINARRVFITAFVISGALAALAGIFVSAETVTVSYSTGDALLTLTFAAVVVGGIGSVPGAVVGGLLIGVGQVMLAGYFSSNFSNGFAYVLMAAVLLIWPTGLFKQEVVARA
jgi:branched-chain amino acid transport system permease protein